MSLISEGDSPVAEEVIPEETKLEEDTIPNQETEELDKSDDSDNDSNKCSRLEDDLIDEDALKDAEKLFSETELQERHQQSTEMKLKGNDEFKNGNYMDSLKTYTEALRLCPLSETQTRSILYGNRAASKMKIDRIESAIDDCTKAIELDKDYMKAILRRAKLYEQSDKLDESLEDFKRVLEMEPSHKEAQEASVRLPPLITEKNEKLKEEMFDKLKGLGNMFLKPFGLSTENFKMVQDPNSGGYSINFQQNPNT